MDFTKIADLPSEAALVVLISFGLCLFVWAIVKAAEFLIDLYLDDDD